MTKCLYITHVLGLELTSSNLVWFTIHRESVVCNIIEIFNVATSSPTFPNPVSFSFCSNQTFNASLHHLHLCIHFALFLCMGLRCPFFVNFCFYFQIGDSGSWLNLYGVVIYLWRTNFYEEIHFFYFLFLKILQEKFIQAHNCS